MAITDEDLRDVIMMYYMTVVYRVDCACYDYLIECRDALLNEIVALSAKSGLKPRNILTRYQNRLHYNHSKILAD